MNFGEKYSYKHILVHIEELWKNRFFSALGGQKDTQNEKNIENSEKITMSALGNLDHQNDDLKFSSAEKRNFWKKIPLERDFGANWTILKKSIFFGPKLQGGRGGAPFFSVNLANFPLLAPYKKVFL